MLPGLERLSLGDATAGFYELTAAERQRVADEGIADPITFDNPTHVMTFRIQMDTPNPDGTPRYAYYSPAVLWDWVKQSSSNGKLPHNPSQKILKEDWYRLHANYDQTGPVPHWVNQLEREHLFLARMAQAEQRVRDRLAVLRVVVAGHDAAVLDLRPPEVEVHQHINSIVRRVDVHEIEVVVRI